MFKKLLSNLPFNPSLIGQVSFYAKRMHRETSIRRLGLILVIFAFFIQFFAFISPPQPTLAASGNDIIPGGFTTQASAVNWCNTNLEIKTIYGYFGVSCDAIAHAAVQTRNTRDYNSQLYSLGRYPYGKPGETPVRIGAQTFYMRYLWGWGTYNFQALVGTRSNGTPFMIMFDCGNIVIVGAPTPPPPPPSTPPPPPPSTPPPVTQPKCPLDNSINKNDLRCTPCPYNPSIIATNVNCKPPVCPLDKTINADSPKCKSCPYNPQILRDNPQCQQCPYPGLGAIGKNNPLCKEPCPYNSTISKDSPSCKPCDQATSNSDASACLILSKTASNTTQHINKADGTTANAGDVIEYSLETKNTGKAAVPNFTVQENIGDILEYADVIDYHNGKFDQKTQIVTWPGATIAANSSLVQHLTIKIKSPIPSTPVSTSNPGTGDLTMTNVYGNAVEIKLPPSVIKTTEQLTTATVLPNTGPGESLAITFAITTIVAYFFARSRLLAKELDIVRSDYANIGGA
jgi:uncharacterized repeat protein (TIGR01451 family)